MDMTKLSERRKSILSFLLKLLVVLIFPLEAIISPSYIGWASILIRVSTAPSLAFTSFPSLAIGLIILLPCIVFERKLYSKPISESVRRQVVLACFLSWIIGLGLLLFIPRPWTMIYIYSALNYTPLLAITFFVVLPLILREARMRAISGEHRQLSYGILVSSLGKRFRRDKFLSGLLWFSLIFSPFMFSMVLEWWSFQVSYVSVFYIMLGNTWSIFAEFLFPAITLTFNANNTGSLLLVVLLSSIRFIFVRDIFRYQKRTIDKSRLASIAILGEVLPAATATLLMLLSGFSVFPAIFPMPILPIVGLIFLRFSKVKPLKDELWPQYEHRMWYEKGHEPYTQEPADESIKVPISYLLVSQVRKFRHKS